MKQSYKILFLILTFLTFFACSGRKQVELSKRLVGINGEATYIFNNRGGVAGVVKDDYNHPTYNFTGTLHTGDEVIPFNYEFIVISKA